MSPENLKQLTKKMLELLGAEEVSIVVTTGHRTVVAVITQEKDAERFVGKDGEHLRALNNVMRRLVEKEHNLPERQAGEKSPGFLIDINGHHEAEAEKVRTGARVLAQRVRLFKHDIEMEPMSSYERLVVHELFAEDSEIKTESAGEGKFRHIVLKYAKA
ncbi:MAG: R3H domain-containing nucleic acid-binding protein [bacterium]